MVENITTTGMMGVPSINCHKADKIGKQAIELLSGKYFGNIPLKIINRVSNLNSVNTID